MRPPAAVKLVTPADGTIRRHHLRGTTLDSCMQHGDGVGLRRRVAALILRRRNLTVDTGARPRVVAGVGVMARLHRKPLPPANTEAAWARAVLVIRERQVFVRVQNGKSTRPPLHHPGHLRDKVGDIAMHRCHRGLPCGRVPLCASAGSAVISLQWPPPSHAAVASAAAAAMRHPVSKPRGAAGHARRRQQRHHGQDHHRTRDSSHADAATCQPRPSRCRSAASGQHRRGARHSGVPRKYFSTRCGRRCGLCCC